jgi:hypothetical protein
MLPPVHLCHASHTCKFRYRMIGNRNAKFLETPPQRQNESAAHDNSAYLTKSISLIKYVLSPTPQTSVILEIVFHS